MRKILLVILLTIFITDCFSQSLVGIIASSMRTTTSSTLLNGLIAYYKLDEASGTVVDSKNAYNSSAVSATYGTTGKLGTAIAFTTTSSRITLAEQTAWTITRTNSYTISMWLYFTNVSSTSYFNLFGDYNGWCLYIKPDSPPGYRFSWWVTGTPSESTTQTISINTWYHLVFVKSGSNITYYLNNSSIATPTEDTGYTTKDPAAVYIGGDAEGEYFPGRIDELAFYRRAFSSAGVDSLYNSGSGRTYPFN